MRVEMGDLIIILALNLAFTLVVAVAAKHYVDAECGKLEDGVGALATCVQRFAADQTEINKNTIDALTTVGDILNGRK